MLLQRHNNRRLCTQQGRSTTPRPKRTYRPTLPTPTPVKAQEAEVVRLTAEEVEQWCRMNQVKAGQCGKHPDRKGVFEEESGTQGLCRQCAIEAVRMNRRVIGVSQSRLMLKNLLEEQLQTIDKEQTAALQVVKAYYEDVKDSVMRLYQNSHQLMQQDMSVHFGEYAPSTSLAQIPQILGKLQPYQILFEPELKETENNSWNRQKPNSSKTELTPIVPRKFKDQTSNLSIESVKLRYPTPRPRKQPVNTHRHHARHKTPTHIR